MQDSKNKGWVRLHRQIEDSWLYFLEPFTKSQAWIDLFLNANHTDSIFTIRGNIIDLKRGQLAWSEITMSKRWKWSRVKVRNFLKTLKSRQQIGQQSLPQITTITTIMEYEKYQKDTTDRTTEEPQKDHRQDINKNDKELKNDKNENILKVFEIFEKEFGTQLKVKDDERKKKIEAILKVFSLTEIEQGIHNFAVSDFHRGRLPNKKWKADFDWVIRSPKQIESGILLAQDSPKKEIKFYNPNEDERFRD